MSGGEAPAGHARLSALQVTGGEGQYPVFDPGVLHYAVRCAAATTLQVAAQAEARDATLRLLHDGTSATGSLHAAVTVNSDHDIAVEVSHRRGATTYYLHCIRFPRHHHRDPHRRGVRGLLLMTPSVTRPDRSFLAIVDNNGVPRWVRRANVHAGNFRRHPDGRYSFSERVPDAAGRMVTIERIVLLDADFERIGTVTLAATWIRNTPAGSTFSSWRTATTCS